MKKVLFAIALTAGVMLAGCTDKKASDNGSSTAKVDENSTEAVAIADEEGTSSLLKTGSPAPSFTLTDVNGKELSLSDLKGKTVVIDFWGTWCGWCMKGIPEMAKMYEKYNDRLEILSVDCGDSEGEWKDAVRDNGMSWTNVRDADNEVAESYGIEGFPTKIVVDADGNIQKVFEGEVKEFYEYIDEIMKEDNAICYY